MNGGDRNPFLTWKALLTRIYGEPLYRVPIDPGFSCPNRAPDGTGGCIFCAEDGGHAPHVPPGTIESQIEAGIEFARRRYGGRRFMAYLQAFTGTFAPRPERRALYRRILSAAHFDAVSIGTRPDCLGQEAMEDLDELRESVDVWAELGIQTAHDDTLLRIRRGHTWDCSKSAARELRARGYRVVAHVILGLPGETAEHWNRTADELAALPPDAVKIHNLHVIRGSGLAREYERNPFPVPDETTYARAVVDFIRRTPESVAIARINTDTPADRLLAPHWSVSKSEFRNMVIRTMAGNGYRQGDLCRKN